MDRSAPGYGLVTVTDVEVLERTLQRCIDEFPGETLRLLDIGVHRGDTTRALARYLSERDAAFEYFAVDSGKEAGEAPFPECQMIWGDSAEVFMKAPDRLHWVFIDGCHCSNHAVLDFCNYGCLVIERGYVLFHDASPRAQRRFDYQGHGPREAHEFGSAVPTALQRLGLSQGCRTDWILVVEGWDEQNWGGVAVYRRENRHEAPSHLGKRVSMATGGK